MNSLYYRRDGSPYGGEGWKEWVKDFAQFDKKVVQQDVLANGKFVSTIWLGLDHNMGGRPHIFETMVFPKKGNYSELETRRYSTEEEAKEGHAALVEKWSKLDNAASDE